MPLKCSSTLSAWGSPTKLKRDHHWDQCLWNIGMFSPLLFHYTPHNPYAITAKNVDNICCRPSGSAPWRRWRWRGRSSARILCPMEEQRSAQVLSRWLSGTGRGSVRPRRRGRRVDVAVWEMGELHIVSFTFAGLTWPFLIFKVDLTFFNFQGRLDLFDSCGVHRGHPLHPVDSLQGLPAPLYDLLHRNVKVNFQ